MTKLTINFLKECDKAYAEGNPIISDSEYDILRTILYEKYPNDPYWGQVGYEIFDSDFTHSIPMGSLEKLKLKDKESIKKFFELRGVPKNETIILDAKIDGLSGSLIYDSDLNLIAAATRGDGIKGKNITSNIRYVEYIPHKLDKEKLSNFEDIKKIEIRGEIFKNKFEFEKNWKNKGFKNPRNFAAGSIRQLDPMITKERKLSFVAYDIFINDKILELDQLDKMKILVQLGFKIPLFIKWNYDPENFQKFFKLIDMIHDMLEKDAPYETDGLVLKLNSYSLHKKLGYTNEGKIPKFFIALKFPAKAVESTVTKIEFNLGKTGRITPLIYIEPVELLGSTISKVTMHNASVYKDSNIGIGSRVLIKKFGEIIPGISLVLTEGEKVPLPEKCPECNQELFWNGKHLECRNESCPAIVSAIIYNFIKEQKVKGLASKSLEKMIKEFNITKPSDLFSISEDQMKKLFGETSGSNKYKTLEDIKSKASIISILRGLSIGNAGRMLDLIIKKFNIKKISDLFNLSVKDISSIPGLAEKKAKLILDDLNKWKEELLKLEAILITKN